MACGETCLLEDIEVPQRLFSFDDNIETRPGSLNRNFLMANLFQAPRRVRLGAKYSW